MAVKATIVDELQVANLLSSADYMEGLIFAVAACPEIPMPERWMPWVLNIDAGHSLSKQQADQLADDLMGRLRNVLDRMRQDKPLLPGQYAWSKDDASRLALQNWLKGLLTGHQQLQPNWQAAWKDNEQSTVDLEDLSVRLTRCLKLFTTLANPDLALANTVDSQRSVLLEGLPKLAESLGAMLKEYVEISGELVQVLPNQFEVVPKSEL